MLPQKIPSDKLWLIFIFIIGLSLRIYRLGEHNLWYDEVISFMFSNSISALKNIFLDWQPPLYYTLLHIWRSFFGSTEFALRSLSMLFGVFTIPLIYGLGKLLFNNRVGLASAFILSVSPIHIWYSQEARGYSLSTFIVILIVYFLYLALEKNSFIYWAGLLVSSLMGVYTNYFIFLALAVATILFFQSRYRDKFKKWLVLCFAVMTGFLFWLPVSIKQLAFISQDSWILRPRPKSIIISLQNFCAGFNATVNISFVMFIVFSVLFIIGLVCWFKTKKIEVAFLAYFIFIPILIVFFISQARPVYLTRQLMLFSPFYYIIAASGLEKIRQPVIRLGIYMTILLLTSTCLFNYFSYRMPSPYIYHEGVFVKKPVKPAADYIKSNLKKEDLVCSSSIYSRQMQYYLLPEITNKQFAHVIMDSELGKMSLFNRLCRKYGRLLAQFKPIIQAGDKATIPGTRLFKEYNFQRIWLVSPYWSKELSFEPFIGEVRSWIRAHYLLVEYKDFNGIVVELFYKKYNNSADIFGKGF